MKKFAYNVVVTKVIEAESQEKAIDLLRATDFGYIDQFPTYHVGAIILQPPTEIETRPSVAFSSPRNAKTEGFHWNYDVGEWIRIMPKRHFVVLARDRTKKDHPFYIWTGGKNSFPSTNEANVAASASFAAGEYRVIELDIK